MKTAIFFPVFFLLLLSMQLRGQTQTGDVLLQTNLSYFKQETVLSRLENETITSSDVNARIGFFVSDKVVLGGGLGYSQLKESGKQYLNQDEYIRYNVSVSMVNYYFYAALQSKITERLRSNFSLDLRFGRGKYKEYGSLYGSNLYGTFDYDGKLNDNEVILRPGFIYFLGRSVLLSLDYGELGFSNSTLDSEEQGSNESNLVIVNMNPNSLRIGIAFYFRKKEKKDI